MPGPNAKGFALQWNIGFILCVGVSSYQVTTDVHRGMSGNMGNQTGP